MLEIIRTGKLYDVCIIGSGAAGGAAAKVLTEGGLNVVMLEAGPMVNPATDYKEHVWPYELAHRGAGIGGAGIKDFSQTEFLAPNGYWTIEGEPYTKAPGSNFMWFRSRIVGGRTNHWGRIALRFAEADFRSRSRDGRGDDWPLTYRDIEPYYDKVDRYIGVYGTRENIPSAPDGIFQPPPKPRCSDLVVKRACDKLRILCVPAREAILTQPLNGRPPCHYCDQCGRGCKTASNFSSSQVLIPPAMATGRLTLVTNAMARDILVNDEGKAAGVSYVDKTTRRDQQVRAKAVVVAGSSCESARLLLNSRSRRFPQGLANSSGVVGRYLMDSVGSDGAGYIPVLEKMPPHNHEGTGGLHLYIPWWKFDRKNEFLRGYHIEFGGGRHMPNAGEFHGVCHHYEGYGLGLKRQCKQKYGAFIGLSGRGEMIPNENTYCDIDPNVVDEWGIPVLRFHFQWGENEIKMARDMQQTFRAIVEAAGGTYLAETKKTETQTDSSGETMKSRGDFPYGLSTGGEIIHETGTVRMGNDPKTSALNRFCQAHDVKNLFVTDGACFVTNPDKNPTLSILAFSWRASEYLLEEARKGNI